MSRRGQQVMLWLLAVCLSGCATTATPYVGYGPHPQISRGRPVPVIDFIGNIFAIPSKLLLWSPKMDNHAISADTEQYLIEYIDSPLSKTDGTLYSLNEYAPLRAMKRLVKNHKVAWPYRLVLGLPTTLIVDVLIPGRLFAGFFIPLIVALPADNYNPFTDTVSIYSDLPSVALHEAGHSHDSNRRKYKGTYAAVRLIPGVALYQEFQASDEAITQLVEAGHREEELRAYKILYPAYGTYVGGLIIPFIGPYVGAAIGHIWGRTTAHDRAKQYEELDRTTQRHPEESAPPKATTSEKPAEDPAAR